MTVSADSAHSATPLCDCGHARSQHDTHEDGTPWFCVAEVPMGDGAYDGNVCICMEYDPAEPLTCAVCQDTIPSMKATIASRGGKVVALCPRHSDAAEPTSNGAHGPDLAVPTSPHEGVQ